MLAVLLLGNVAATHPQAQSENCRYFAETDCYVCDRFLEFFDARGGVEIFGYPLTEEFDDPTHNGLRVQYFQRARMEWHPHNPEPYQVQLGLLADELGYNTYPPARPEQIPATNSALHHYFPETQHVVSYAFLDYFREKGGLDIFGYPRSEFMYEAGYVVQYFQRARMEWHPEDDTGSQMRLTKIGEIYIDEFGIPDNYEVTVRIDPDPSQRQATKLNISASVRYAITGRQGVQTVFVYVNDQQYQPIQGANVQIVVQYQSGAQPYELEPTDASGFTKWSFDILPSPPGKRVVIDVTVTYDNMVGTTQYNRVTGTTQTFFLPWW
jgi:hypothetical protein